MIGNSRPVLQSPSDDDQSSPPTKKSKWLLATTATPCLASVPEKERAWDSGLGHI